MAIVASLSGESGTGKSRSQKNMHWGSTFVIRPNRKPFPWKFADAPLKAWDSKEKTGNFIYLTDYAKINAVMTKLPEYGFTKIIIEDSTHLLLEEYMATAQEKGYDKFTNAALHYYELLRTAESLPDNIRVYIINHVDENQNGDEIIKVIGGKLITEKIDVPSLLTIALRATKTKDGYFFRTQSNGRSFHKSPDGMFDKEYIPNDLNEVDKLICEYYGLEFEHNADA
jgi:hypothetical protein